jgi:hypothetical protein
MKEVATVTVRQDADEPRLIARIYRNDMNFYIRIESNHPAIPLSMPMRINVTNFKDAKDNAEKLLHIVRGVFRTASGKAPDLPERLKEIEGEVPAFLHFLLTNDFVGQN